MFDLSGVEGVFDELGHSMDDGVATVFVDEGRDLWMYARSDIAGGGDIHGLNNDESRYVYYGGVPVRSYGNHLSPYCVCLGFGGGDYASFSFDETPSDISFASVNVPRTIEALSVLRDNSAYGFVERGSGLSCNIDLDADKYVLLTLPYDKGFTIRDNGKKVDYYAYAGALICFKLDKGTHMIDVDYMPYGIVTGLIVSLTASVILGLMFFVTRVRNNKKRED